MLQTIFYSENQLLSINQHITNYTGSSVHLFSWPLFLAFFFFFSSSNVHRLGSLSNHASKDVVSYGAVKLPTLQLSQLCCNLGQEKIFLLILYCASHSQFCFSQDLLEENFMSLCQVMKTIAFLTCPNMGRHHCDPCSPSFSRLSD